MAWGAKWLDRIFTYEAIGRSGVTYLDRWIIGKLGDRRLYLHRFILDDPEEPHNHPRVFISLLFRGSYREEIFYPEGHKETRQFKAPYLRRFSPEHAHRISRCNGAWSLVLVGKRQQDWGFRSGSRWISPEELEARSRTTQANPARDC
jgi:hypothetical protein